MNEFDTNDTYGPDDSVTFSGDQKIKIKRLVEEGMRTMHEIDTLKEGLGETIKAVAEELNIKPAPLRKAIRIAHKASLHEENKNHDVVNTILEAAGKTL
jgi:hypothetical protein